MHQQPQLDLIFGCFPPKHTYSLKIPQKYLDKRKSNSNNTTERNFTRSSPQNNLETSRDLQVLLSIFKSLTPTQSGSELVPHPKAMVCIDFPHASVAPTKLPKCVKFACP